MDNFKNHIRISDKMFKNMLKITHPIKKDFEEIYSNLTDEQIQTLVFYKGSGYYGLNQLLFNNKLYLTFDKLASLNDIIKASKDEYLKKIKILDDLFFYKSKKKIKTFRGIKYNHAEEFNKLDINDTYLFKNYISTSLYPSQAFSFSAELNTINKNNKKTRILLEFELPKNFSFFYLTWLDYINYNNNNVKTNKSLKKNNIKKKSSKKKQITEESLGVSEFEILLPRNCLFKIDKISTIDERFFTKSGNTWGSYEKYLNNESGYKKIKIYHLKFVERKEPTSLDLENPEIDPRGFELDNIYYIPPKQSNMW